MSTAALLLSCRFFVYKRVYVVLCLSFRSFVCSAGRYSFTSVFVTSCVSASRCRFLVCVWRMVKYFLLSLFAQAELFE